MSPTSCPTGKSITIVRMFSPLGLHSPKKGGGPGLYHPAALISTAYPIGFGEVDRKLPQHRAPRPRPKHPQASPQEPPEGDAATVARRAGEQQPPQATELSQLRPQQEPCQGG